MKVVAALAGAVSVAILRTRTAKLLPDGRLSIKSVTEKVVLLTGVYEPFPICISILVESELMISVVLLYVQVGAVPGFERLTDLLEDANVSLVVPLRT